MVLNNLMHWSIVNVIILNVLKLWYIKDGALSSIQINTETMPVKNIFSCFLKDITKVVQKDHERVMLMKEKTLHLFKEIFK